MASFHFFKREAEENRPRRVQNMSDFGPNFILEREKRHYLIPWALSYDLFFHYIARHSLAETDHCAGSPQQPVSESPSVHVGRSVAFNRLNATFGLRSIVMPEVPPNVRL